MPNKSSQPRQLQTSASLEAKEEQYRKLNAQLEAKTARLIREADEVLENIHNSNSKQHEIATDDRDHKQQCSSRLSDQSDGETENVVTQQDEHETSKFEGDLHYDPLPGPANQLSLKAQNRYLRAKVRVLHEETQKLSQELKSCHEETSHLKKRLQELEEERNRLHRTTSSHSSQVEKVKKSLEEAKTQHVLVEAERNTLKKEKEYAKRALDKQAAEFKSTSVRLQRALEEVERLRSELEAVRSQNREATDTMKQTIERLTSNNRRLERQKSDLITAFKKQLRLIDVLRKQKLLIEASKCLQLTEEEFLKALDLKPP